MTIEVSNWLPGLCTWRCRCPVRLGSWESGIGSCRRPRRQPRDLAFEVLRRLLQHADGGAQLVVLCRKRGNRGIVAPIARQQAFGNTLVTWGITCEIRFIARLVDLHL